MGRAGKDIINLSRIASNDGGSQTACSFLQQLAEVRDAADYRVVAFRNTSAGELAQRLGYDCLLVDRNVRQRAWLDLACRSLFEKGQVCFTFHGAPWYRSRGYLVNLCGAADSNLYYPEIRFWKHCGKTTQAVKYVKDRGRMFGYSRADYWVFETQTLCDRAVRLAGYPADRTAVVKMSPSAFVSPERVDDGVREEFRQRLNGGFAFLFMAGANPNKRIVYIGPALARIRNQKLTDRPIRVVTTLDPDSDYYRTIQREFTRLGVEDTWINLGPIPFDKIPSLIDACDVVCLFSVLESFSSNMTEAWAMSKPLLVVDADWSRSACGEVARFISPEDVDGLIAGMLDVMQPDFRRTLLSTYQAHLATYPLPRERCLRYLECIEKTREAGSLTGREQRQVRRFTCLRRP